MVSWIAPGSVFEAQGIDFGFPRLDSVAVVTNFSKFSCEQTLQEPLSITMARPKKNATQWTLWPNCSFYANPCVQKFETSYSLFPQELQCLKQSSGQTCSHVLCHVLCVSGLETFQDHETSTDLTRLLRCSSSHLIPCIHKIWDLGIRDLLRSSNNSWFNTIAWMHWACPESRLATVMKHLPT